MEKNMELFEQEINDIREYSEIDIETFHDVLDCTRRVIVKYGERISPMATVDVIEGAVEQLTYSKKNDPINVKQAVRMAVENLGISEMDEMFETVAEYDSHDFSDGNNKIIK